MTDRRQTRLLFLLVGALAMAAGFWTGLAQLGVAVPAPTFTAAEFHGALMIAGFLGTVISLERAVAVGLNWAYAAPALSSLGALALLADLPLASGAAFLAAGLVLLAASLVVAARQLALFTVVLALGAACWAAGTFKWLAGDSMPAAAGWWLNFLILTIAAERLELSRILSLTRASLAGFALVVCLLLLGSARDELDGDWAPLYGAGLVGGALWLLIHDVARRTARLGGLPRFSAVSILTGHLWLGTAGLILLLAPFYAIAFPYDAAVHAITIGFVLSMIFGHAPIILPAVTGLKVQYSDFAFAPLLVLHLSAILRVGGGIGGGAELRAVSGVLTVAALAGYAATLVVTSRRARRRPA